MRFEYKMIAILLLSCVVLSCSMPLHAFALNSDVAEGFVNKYFSGIATFPAFQLSKLLALYGVHVDYEDIGLMEYTDLINSMDSYTFTNALGQTTKLSDAISAISAVGGGSFMYLLRNVYRPNDTFGACFQDWISDHFGSNIGDTGFIGYTNELVVYPGGTPLRFSGYNIRFNEKVTFDIDFCYKNIPFILFAREDSYPAPLNTELTNKFFNFYALPANLQDYLTLYSSEKCSSAFQYVRSTDPASAASNTVSISPSSNIYNGDRYYCMGFTNAYQSTWFFDYDFYIYKIPNGISTDTFVNMYYSGQIGIVDAVVYDTPDLNDLPDPNTDSGSDFYKKYLTLGDEAYYYLSSSITNNYVDSTPELVQYTNEYVTNNYDINISLPNISDLIDFNVDLGSTTSDYVESEHGLFTSANTKISEFESTMPDLELLPGLLSGISFCSTFLTDFFYASGGSTGGYGIIFGLSVTFLLLSLIIGVSSFIGKGGK